MQYTRFFAAQPEIVVCRIDDAEDIYSAYVTLKTEPRPLFQPNFLGLVGDRKDYTYRYGEGVFDSNGDLFIGIGDFLVFNQDKDYMVVKGNGRITLEADEIPDVLKTASKFTKKMKR